MSWEYLIARHDSMSPPIDDLNKLGKEGWELVAVTTPTFNGPNRAAFYFKRRIKSEGDRP